jgi:Mg-dependent DNase
VGETGLDFYWKDVTPEEQERAFRRHLELARQTDLPPVIHCREAEARTLAVLDDMGFRDRPLLWHCFGGDDALAREILSRGWHVSVPGTVTYARNEPLRAAVARIPADRLVLETDCPYLTPEPWRGKQNHPALVGFTAVAVAGLRGVPVEELWALCADNAGRFFRALGPAGKENKKRQAGFRRPVRFQGVEINVLSRFRLGVPTRSS